MGSSSVAFKYFFFHFFIASLFVFISDYVYNWIHLFEFDIRLCNKYTRSAVNYLNKPTCN